jgi:Ethanolamine ammonia lyase large subunit (EutB)
MRLRASLIRSSSIQWLASLARNISSMANRLRVRAWKTISGGKLLGLPMGCDICYTNHAEADQNDMDTLLTLLGVAGVNFIMGVPGADDIMLNYQSTSFHDALYLREALGLKRTPEFEAWLERMGITDEHGRLLPAGKGRTLADAFETAMRLPGSAGTW